MGQAKKASCLGLLVALFLLAAPGASCKLEADQVIYTTDNPPEVPKLSRLERRDSITQFGVTWSFGKKVPVGRFVNGDYYVVGPVRVVSVEPKFVTDARKLAPQEVPDPASTRKDIWRDTPRSAFYKWCRRHRNSWTDTLACSFAHNGSLLNPVPGEYSGFDSRVRYMRYDPRLPVKLPVEMKPGDVLLSSISRKEEEAVKFMVGESSFGSPPWELMSKRRIATEWVSAVKTTALLTCLANPVPADAFRPAYCDRSRKIYLARNLRRDLLPRLKGVKNTPRLQEWERIFQRPWTDPCAYSLDAPWENMPTGRELGRAVGVGTLLLCLDFPPREKEGLLICSVQAGIDLWSWTRGRRIKRTAGMGRKWAILFAGIMLGDEDMQSLGGKDAPLKFVEDTETRYGRSWTGANAIFHPYERLHPSRWPRPSSAWARWPYLEARRRYRSVGWVGQALAARLMKAEKLWGHGAFFDYVDRWMTEDDGEQVASIKLATGQDYTARSMRQRQALDRFVEQMWAKYRGRVELAGPWFPVAETARESGIKIGPNREFRVGGKPFFPLMLFGQTPKQIDEARAIGVNTFFENGSKLTDKQFLDKLSAKGLYGVLGADAEIVGHPHLLGLAHTDQPDRPILKRKARVIPGAALRPTGRSLMKLENLGKGKGSAMLDPMAGAELTVLVPQETPEIYSLAIKTSGAATIPREIELIADGRTMLRTTLPPKPGQNRFDLAQPVRIREKLVLKIHSTYRTLWTFGPFGPIEMFDKNGKPVPLYELDRAPARSPEQVADAYRWMKKVQKTRPVFLTFSPAFMKRDGGLDEATGKNLYSEYIKSCDVAGMVVSSGEARPDLVAKGMRRLRALSGAQRPTVAWINAALGKPRNVRAQAWAAIIGGACALGYRTQRNGKPWALDEPMGAELKRLNGRITRLAPAILAGPARVKVGMAISGGLACHFKATGLEGSLYIFAQNIASRPGKAVLKVEGLKAGTKVEVIDEGRTITADEGAFSDQFAPLSEHLYQVRP